ncbi:MAG TPA: hypothetical protein VEC02_02370 [Nitrososphaerales archaeon]|nr:hypothetical protein [Nitrososphaerales archaeon]
MPSSNLPLSNAVHVLQVTLWKSMVTYMNSLVPQRGRLALFSEGAWTVARGMGCSVEV